MKRTFALATAIIVGISCPKHSCATTGQAQLLNNEAKALILQGKLDKALERETEGARLAPGDSLPHKAMTFIYIQQGKLDDALREARIAEHLSPADPSAAYNLGRVLQSKGKYSHALAAYKRCIKHNPSDLNPRLGAAQCLLSMHQVDECIDLLEAASDYHQHSAELWINLAIAYLSKENLADAENAASRAVRLDPSSWEASRILGQIEYTLNNQESALKLAKRLISLCPENRNGYLFILRCLQRQRPSIAYTSALLEKAHSAIPSDAPLFYSLGVSFLKASETCSETDASGRTGDESDWWNLAERAFRYATLAAPEQAQGHLALSTVLAIEDKSFEALSEAEQASKAAPESKVVQRQLTSLKRNSNDLAWQIRRSLRNLLPW